MFKENDCTALFGSPSCSGVLSFLPSNRFLFFQNPCDLVIKVIFIFYLQVPFSFVSNKTKYLRYYSAREHEGEKRHCSVC